MSASVMSDPYIICHLQECPAAVPIIKVQAEVEFVECRCCGLTEECTPAYIERIRAIYSGKWICGLCAEAVKEEIARKKRVISTEEAVTRHTNFCKKNVSSGPPPDPTVLLISAMKQIMRKSLDYPRSLSSNPTSIKRTDSMRGSSLQTISLVESQSSRFL